MTGPMESALLAAVERSPAAAAAHDRRGWVGLFTDDGRVEDPVGSRPHAVGLGDRFAALQALSSGATITFGDDEAADVSELIGRCSGAAVTKLIAAGATVAASVASVQRRGILFADVARGGTGIQRVRYFAQ
ncbi:hypothetical protein [Mycobacterium sp.]|uniref:hypothetical protein n=1 Tax=Mycobacterium sp. TaxID=1785 RepID=UPI003D0F9EF9